MASYPEGLKEIIERFEGAQLENQMSPAARTARRWSHFWREAKDYPSLAGGLIGIMRRYQDELKEQGVIVEGLPFFMTGELGYVVGRNGDGLPLYLREAQERARQTEELVYPVVNKKGVPQRCLPAREERQTP